MTPDHKLTESYSVSDTAGPEAREWWRLYRYRRKFLYQEEMDLLHEITVRPVSS